MQPTHAGVSGSAEEAGTKEKRKTSRSVHTTFQDLNHRFAGRDASIADANGESTPNLVTLIVCVPDGEEGNLDAVEDTPLHEPGEVGHDSGIFVFSGTIVHLEEECLGENAVPFHLQPLESPLQNLDGQVRIVGHVLGGVVDGGRGLPVDHRDDQVVTQTDSRVLLGELREVGNAVTQVLAPTNSFIKKKTRDTRTQVPIDGDGEVFVGLGDGVVLLLTGVGAFVMYPPVVLAEPRHGFLLLFFRRFLAPANSTVEHTETTLGETKVLAQLDVGEVLPPDPQEVRSTDERVAPRVRLVVRLVPVVHCLPVRRWEHIITSVWHLVGSHQDLVEPGHDSDAKLAVSAELLVCLRTVQLVRGAYAENIHGPPVARPVATAESRAVLVVNFALLHSRQAVLLKGLSKGEKLFMLIFPELVTPLVTAFVVGIVQERVEVSEFCPLALVGRLGWSPGPT